MSSSPLILSSGDPALDRRLDWARALLDEGNAADAAELMAEAVTRAPGFVSGWFVLAEAREAMGERDAAAQAYGAALTLDPKDRLGAGPRRARLAGEGTGLSAAYVRTLFDQYAGRFDAALARLDYRGPELIRAALEDACAALGRPFRFAHGLDLGCGTGLVGMALAPRVERLDGVDLAPNMIELARARGLYRELAAADLVGWLQERPEAGADLVVAGDVFCYLGDLAPVFMAARRAIGATAPTAPIVHLTAPTGHSHRSSGLLAFTVETHDGAGVILRDTLRVAHGEAYVREQLFAAGFDLVSCRPAATRTEKGAPVPGLVVVARPLGAKAIAGGAVKAE
ncbi:class I SAM-dependent DNA methyltransferase [Ancylobacter terrae]|uniref:class I SAM-dependent DNA methyltransferase n=1 Tax=Ancylobacter sp. sgz301288 TaxID=3342077 RepID=UPI00385FD4FB